ncbi:hypothetical protein D3C72_2269880 [compost metagenome]
MGEFGQVRQQGLWVGAQVIEFAQRCQRFGDAATHQVFEQVDDPRPVAQAQHGLHGCRRDRSIAMGNRLVEQ